MFPTNTSRQLTGRAAKPILTKSVFGSCLSTSEYPSEKISKHEREDCYLSQPQYFFAGLIPDGAIWPLITALVSAVLGYGAGRRHEQIKDRKASNRRRVEFIAWLRGLKAESQERIMQLSGYRLNWPAFTKAIPDFISACELVRIEIPKNRLNEFDSVALFLSNCGPADFNNKESRQQVYDAIERLVSIVRP